VRACRGLLLGWRFWPTVPVTPSHQQASKFALAELEDIVSSNLAASRGGIVADVPHSEARCEDA
jgi:hypothetical protein